MQPEFKVTKIRENLAGLRAAMKALTEQDVFIGIPEDETARKEAEDTGISNAYLGYIHEYGVPEKNIPARPALIPGIEDIREEAAAILKDAAKKALEGNEGAVGTALNKIGLRGTSAVQKRFVENDWPSLALETRRGRLREKAKAENWSGKKWAKQSENPPEYDPLIDSSQLRKAYTYVIREKGTKGLIVK